MATTKIDWATKTWNIIEGCSKASPGCRDCYALRLALRMSENPTFGVLTNPYKELLAGKQWSGRVRMFWCRIDEPARMKKPQRIFVASRSDLFHENLPFQKLQRIWRELARPENRRHTFPFAVSGRLGLFDVEMEDQP